MELFCNFAPDRSPNTSALPREGACLLVQDGECATLRQEILSSARAGRGHRQKTKQMEKETNNAENKKVLR